ncbi:MAG: hypothetical protein B6U89_03750 [Desulfurococcales archaeon ex4484_58]|nr:MAG: hypothetical protein B6U89_03750 [Desulfurococcales archaeon ex4484_58]
MPPLLNSMKSIIRDYYTLSITLLILIVSPVITSNIQTPITYVQAPVIDEINNDTNTIFYFYIYGYHGCPHCGAMYRFLSENYGKDHVYFCDVYASRECSTSFYEIINNTLPPSVPTIFIVCNCTVSAIVIGEYKNKTFFDSLLKPNNKPYVPVYMAWSYSKDYVVGENHYRFIRKYLLFNNYCIIPNNIDYYFYIYSGENENSTLMYRVLSSYYGENHVYYCNVTVDPSCKAMYNEIINLNNTLFQNGSILTFIIYNNRVSAILQGIFLDKSFLDKLLRMNTNNTIPVYMNTSNRVDFVGELEVSSHYRFITEYLSYTPYIVGVGNYESPLQTNMYPKYSIIEVLPALFILAFLDSINPCTMILYFSFIIMCISGKRMYGPPILFLAIIYFGYFSLAYIILHVASIIPKQIFIVLVLFMGIYNVVKAGKEHSPSLKCEWCERLGFVSKFMGNKYFLALILAIFSVIFLLPCTAGPLLAFLAILSDYPLEIAIPSLILYNLIFVSPLILLLIATILLGREKRIANWLKNNVAVIEFLTGIALIFIALYLLFTL